MMFHLKGINIWAVLVAWIAAMILGSLWYGPLFGKSWMAAVGITEPEGSPALAMSVMTVAYLMLAIIVTIFTRAMNATTAVKGLAVGILLGVFLMITLLVNVLFENRPMSLFWINGLYAPVEFGVIGLIVGGWQKKKK